MVQTTPPAHSQQDSAWKEATLENGLVIRVPLFIGPGENVRVELRTARYLLLIRLSCGNKRVLWYCARFESSFSAAC